jgi:hypothetical protein
MTHSTLLQARDHTARRRNRRVYAAQNLGSLTGTVAAAVMGLVVGAVFGVLGPPGCWTGRWMGPLGRRISEGPRSLADLYEQP